MKVKFVPQNIELEIAPNQSVKDLADKNGVFIKSICNGLPSCAECRVRIVEGEHNVLPPGNKELNLIGTGYFIDSRRLSCQLLCFGDVTVDLTEQIAKEKTRSSLRPQGSRKPETETSHAVTGNLIEQEAAEIKNIQAPAEQRPQQQRSENSQRGERGGHDRPRQQNQQGGRQQNQQSGRQQPRGQQSRQQGGRQQPQRQANQQQNNQSQQKRQR